MISDRIGGNGLKLCEGQIRLNVMKNCYEKVVEHWQGLPREEVESSFLEAFKRQMMWH